MTKRMLIIFIVVFGIFSMGRMAIMASSEVSAYQSGQGSTPLENLDDPILVTRTVEFSGDSILVEVELSVEGESGSLPNGLIIKEQLPAESILIHSSPPVDTYDSKARVVKWLLIGEEIYSRTLSYEFQTILSMDDIEFKGFYLYKLEGRRISKAIENL